MIFSSGIELGLRAHRQHSPARWANDRLQPIAAIKAAAQTRGMSKRAKRAICVAIIFGLVLLATRCSFSFGHPGIHDRAEDFLASQNRAATKIYTIEFVLFLGAVTLALLWPVRNR